MTAIWGLPNMHFLALKAQARTQLASVLCWAQEQILKGQVHVRLPLGRNSGADLARRPVTAI